MKPIASTPASLAIMQSSLQEDSCHIQACGLVLLNLVVQGSQVDAGYIFTDSKSASQDIIEKVQGCQVLSSTNN